MGRRGGCSSYLESLSHSPVEVLGLLVKQSGRCDQVCAWASYYVHRRLCQPPSRSPPRCANRRSWGNQVLQASIKSIPPETQAFLVHLIGSLRGPLCPVI